MKINPANITTNIWFNDRMGQWNWVLIVEDIETKETQMHSGNALDKRQARHDIMATISWLNSH